MCIIIVVISFDTQHPINFLLHKFMVLQGTFQELSFSSTSSSPAFFCASLNYFGGGEERGEKREDHPAPKKHLSFAIGTDAEEGKAWALLVLSPGKRSQGPTQ